MDYKICFKEAFEALTKGGAFLTVRDKEGRTNTMTIGWGTLGYSHATEIFTVMVRKSRYTDGLMQNSTDFTVSFPMDGRYKKALGYYGKYSGKDVDKYVSCPIPLHAGRKTQSPVVAGCLVMECRTVYTGEINPEHMDEEIAWNWYADPHSPWFEPGDVHHVYVGKIESLYRADMEAKSESVKQDKKMSL